MLNRYFELFRGLDDAQVGYVVVGGFAMLLHGIDRVTADVDLVIDLAPEKALAAIDALTALGYRPGVPIDPRGFADAGNRARWRDERRMLVLSLWDPSNRRPTVDVLAEPPVQYADLARDAVRVCVAGVDIVVASIGHLIRMKQISGRPRDLEDVARLQNHVRESAE